MSRKHSRDDDYREYEGQQKRSKNDSNGYYRRRKYSPSPRRPRYNRRDGSQRSREYRRRNNNDNGRRRQPVRSSGDYKNGNRRRSESSRSSSTHSSSIDDEIGHYYGEIGDLIDQRYEIVELLGKGTFGKVFKCRDQKYNDSVALKVVRNISKYIDSAKIEADILKNIFTQQEKSQRNHCVKMFSSFHYEGYYVMVFERLGLSLYDLIKKNDYKRFPMHVVKEVTRQLLQGIDFLHSINLIHTDLKLENILFVHNTLVTETVRQRDHSYEVFVPRNTRIKIIDFGGATYDDDEDKAGVINTRQYRGPEVTLELGWSFPSDIWSVACIIAEMYCGDLLFQTHEELEHLALMEKLCGAFPLSMLEESRYRYKYFDSAGKVQTAKLSDESMEYLKEFPRNLQEVFSLAPEDGVSGIIELVKDLLAIDPKQRINASRALTYRFCEECP